ncbi:class I SAM-dependent methyltransferase [Rubrivirga sp. S365]|uniref:class I SAM-dependent methyltransferase n=1 Tax=Rubrivirga sp. S365 TaxID=3076080 RepID=UPI0028CA96F7|nr:class I SAM-dependent methyltransferase [Rubrivirga sp. S365]MDT7858134.1 class I SAM-dependent methyltransferase [Rubrivirga sp. S365]
MPRFPGTEPCPTEWGEASRQKSLRALARMGIEDAGQFEAAVAALARLMDGHDDPEAAARQREAEVERMVEAARLSGIPDYFRTPRTLAEQMIDAAGLYGTGRDVRVLEPSAGDGAILDVLRERHPEARVEAVEPSHTLRQIIEAKGHAASFGRPFEHFEPSAPYDAVVMNPPFGRGGIRAMDHVERAASMLAPGGRLVAVVPESCHFRREGRYRAFRAFVEDRGGYWIDLPADAFRESGTGVKTRLVVLDGVG